MADGGSKVAVCIGSSHDASEIMCRPSNRADEDRGCGVAIGDGATIEYTDDSGCVFVSGNVDIGDGEVLHLAVDIVKATKDSLITVIRGVGAAFIDADAADCLIVTIEVTIERFVDFANGGVVAPILAKVGVAVGEIVHQLEVLACVVGAAIHAGGKEVELLGIVNLIRIRLGPACTRFSGPVGRYLNHCDHGVGSLHIECVGGGQIACQQGLTIDIIDVLFAW